VEAQAQEFRERAKELSQKTSKTRAPRHHSAEDYDEVVYFNDAPYSPDSGRGMAFQDVG
jgi:hypothetical protein